VQNDTAEKAGFFYFSGLGSLGYWVSCWVWWIMALATFMEINFPDKDLGDWAEMSCPLLRRFGQEEDDLRTT
jgi:hypothetical protein